MRARRPLAVQVVTDLALGGAQRLAAALAEGLPGHGWDTALVHGPGGHGGGRASAPDVPTHVVPDLARPLRPLADTRALEQLERLLTRLHPDVVQTHTSKAGVLARLAAARVGVPVRVHTAHGWGFTPLQPAPVRTAFRLAERRADRAGTHLVCVSRATLAEGRRAGLRAPAAVIPGAVFPQDAVQVERAEAAARLGQAPPEGPTAVFLGPLKPQKDPAALADAAGRFLAAVPDAQLWVAGDGALADDFDRRVRAGPAADRVVRLGWTDRRADLLSCADVLVLPSRFEGLPLVLLEAAAHGVPAVASAVGGVPEVVHHDRTGLLTPPGDPAALADAVAALLRDPDRRRALGETARRTWGARRIGHMVAETAVALGRWREAAGAARR